MKSMMRRRTAGDALALRARKCGHPDWLGTQYCVFVLTPPQGEVMTPSGNTVRGNPELDYDQRDCSFGVDTRTPTLPLGVGEQDCYEDYDDPPDRGFCPMGGCDECGIVYWPPEEDDEEELYDGPRGKVQAAPQPVEPHMRYHENYLLPSPTVVVVDRVSVQGERPGPDYSVLGAVWRVDVDDPDVVSQLSGSHGEWTGLDDVEKKELNDARKRAHKEAKTNKHRAAAQHKPKKGEKAPEKKKVPCKFFAIGECKYGEKCRFDHSQPAKPAVSSGQKAYMAVLVGQPEPDSDDEFEEEEEDHPAEAAEEKEMEEEEKEEEEHKADAPVPEKPKRQPKKQVEKLSGAQWDQKIRAAKVLIKNDPMGPRRFHFTVSPGESFDSMILRNFRAGRVHPIKVEQRFFSGYKSTLEWLDTVYALWRDEGRLPWVEEDDQFLPENPDPSPDAFGGLAGAYRRLVDHAACKIQGWFRDHAKPVVIQLMQEQVNPQLGCCSPIAGALHYVAKRFRESIFFLRPPPPTELVFDPVERIGTHKLYGEALTTSYRHRFGNEISLQVDSGYTALVNVKTRKKYLKHALKELTPLLLTEHTRRMGIQALLEKYEPMVARHSDQKGAVREVQYMKNAVNWVCQFLETKEVEDISRTSRRTKKALPVVDFR